MPGWLKALLAVAIVIVVLVAGVIVAGVVWWSQNKDALIGRAKEVITEGRDAGRDTDNQGCVDVSITRYKKEPGLSSVISNSIFMRACLESSRPTPGFCDDVPKQLEFAKTARWRVDQCRKFDLSQDSQCQNLFTPMQQFCDERARKSGNNRNVNSY